MSKIDVRGKLVGRAMTDKNMEVIIFFYL